MTPLKIYYEKVEISNILVYTENMYLHGLYGVYIRRRKSHIRFGPTSYLCVCVHVRVRACVYARVTTAQKHNTKSQCIATRVAHAW
jgi:hypothetical protein